MTGFVLAVILTVIPFWVVMGNVFESSTTTALVILSFMVVQIFVHMVFFLHMNGSSSQTWLTMSGIYAVFIVAFVILGSMWIFEHLNHNLLMGH